MYAKMSQVFITILVLTLGVGMASYAIVFDEFKLVTIDAAAEDFFGFSVAIDRDTALVGAIWDDDGGSKSGSAYIFVRVGDTWTQQDKLVASDAQAGDWFGNSVGISGDTAIVGALGNDDAGDR